MAFSTIANPMIVYAKMTAETLALEEKGSLELFFSRLADASIKGVHVVILSFEVVDWVQQNLKVGDMYLSQLLRLKEQYPQRGALVDDAPVLLSIECGDFPVVKDDTHRFRVGVKEVLRKNYLEEVKVVVENAANDGAFYKVLLDSACRKLQIEKLRYFFVHGGGGSIIDPFRSHLESGFPTLCISDSDKLFPADTNSSTVKELKAFLEGGLFVGGVYQTHGRDIENYIPWEILRDHKLRPNFKKFTDLAGLLKRQGNVDKSECLWTFFDVKEGIKGNKICKNDAASDWYSKKLGVPKSDIADFKFPGMGKGTLAEFMASGVARSSFDKYLKSESWRNSFEELYVEICWYLAGTATKHVI